MSAKDPSHNQDKAQAKRPLSKPATENFDQLSQQQPDSATIIQRASCSCQSLVTS